MPTHLSPKEYAALFDVSPKTVRKLVREGLIPGAVKLGGAIRIPREARPQARPSSVAP